MRACRHLRQLPGGRRVEALDEHQGDGAMSTATKSVTPVAQGSAGERGVDDGRGRRRRTRRILVPVAAVVLAVAAVGVVRSFAGNAPAGDSPTYATFGALASASEVFVRGEVVQTASTSVEGTAMTAYTVRVDDATKRVGSEAVVLLPAVEEPADGTAESEPLRVGSSYVMGLVSMGQDWQPTSRAQSVFEVIGDQVQPSSDGALSVSRSLQQELGI